MGLPAFDDDEDTVTVVEPPTYPALNRSQAEGLAQSFNEALSEHALAPGSKPSALIVRTSAPAFVLPVMKTGGGWSSKSVLRGTTFTLSTARVGKVRSNGGHLVLFRLAPIPPISKILEGVDFAEIGHEQALRAFGDGLESLTWLFKQIMDMTLFDAVALAAGLIKPEPKKPAAPAVLEGWGDW